MSEEDHLSRLARVEQRIGGAHEKIESVRMEMARMETDYRREVDRVADNVRSMKQLIARYGMGIIVAVLVGAGSFWLAKVVGA